VKKITYFLVFIAVNHSSFFNVTNNVLVSRVRRIAKSYYTFGQVCLSVRPHGTAGAPLDWFSLSG